MKNNTTKNQISTIFISLLIIASVMVASIDFASACSGTSGCGRCVNPCRPAPLYVTVVPDEIILEIGEIKIFNTTIGPQGVSTSIIWTISDDSIGILCDGVREDILRGTSIAFMGLSTGVATITATSAADSNILGTAVVTVVAPVTKPISKSNNQNVGEGGTVAPNESAKQDEEGQEVKANESTLENIKEYVTTVNESIKQGKEDQITEDMKKEFEAAAEKLAPVDVEQETPSTPGFSIISVIIGLCIAIIYKKNKNN